MTPEQKEKRRLYMREWRARNPQNREYQKQYHAEWSQRPGNAEVVRERARQWYEDNRPRALDNVRKSHLRKKYGISGEQYQAMFDSQDGLCAICETELALCVDHDHDTGQVRALLCRKCNSGIGLLNDDLDLLERAAAYLRRYK